jgi:ABC-type uncharacterized transport system involved in gliding motility auxiliary subunit
MAANWMKARQTKYGAYVTIYVLVILAVLGAVNFLANRYDKSYDSTSNKQYSLSEQTAKVIKGLKSDVHITYFDTDDRFQNAHGLLDRYSNLSSKVHVTYIDPVKKPQQARGAGFTRDSNIVVDSGLRKEPAKSLDEQEITGALIRSLKTSERNVCFLSAGGERSLEEQQGNGFSTLKTLLERDNYKTRTITPKAAAPEGEKQVTIGQKPAAASVDIPKDCTVLVVGGPQLAYTQPVVNAIKSYMEGGGKALFMLDDSLKIGREQSANDSPELLQLLADWGVTVNKDLVLDLSGIGRSLFGVGPEVPVLFKYDSHTITRPLDRVPTAFPIARSLDVKSTGSSTVEKLVSTTDDSVAVSDVGANGAIDIKKGKKGPLTIAAAGTLTSGSNKSRFIVVGTAQWAQNNLTGSNTLGNRDLFSNMINWLSSDEDLISIRPKEQENQALNMTGQRPRMMFWLSVVVFPLAVVGMGLGTWWKRR